MFVGGEFYYDERWHVDQPVISTGKMTFLNGGKACLIVISAWLLDHGIKKILLPSYICPTIVNTLERCGLNCDYYQIMPDFSIDVEDMAHRVIEYRAVYIINYFGFLQPVLLRNYLLFLRQKGVIVVEDNAQAGFSLHASGDFVFNSMRKLAPYDGGYLLTSRHVAPYIQQYQGNENRRLPVIREYRRKLRDYLYDGKVDRGELVRLYNLAEEYYEMDMAVAGDAEERSGIEHLDWNGIRQTRRENYIYLLERLKGVPGISPVFPILQKEIMPMGLPVYVSGVERDKLFDALGNAGIGLTVHWDEILRDPRLNTNHTAAFMASRLLTLVIDQRTSHKQMDYLADTLREYMLKEKG